VGNGGSERSREGKGSGRELKLKPSRAKILASALGGCQAQGGGQDGIHTVRKHRKSNTPCKQSYQERKPRGVVRKLRGY